MKKITNYFLLVYLFGIQFVFYGLRKPDALFVQMGLVNLLVFILGGVLLLCLAHRINSDAIKDLLRQISGGIGWFVEKYAFVLSIFVLLIVSIAQFFVTIPCYVFWILVGFFFYTLIIARQSIWQKTIHFGEHLFMPKDILFWVSLLVAMGIGHLVLGLYMWYSVIVSTVVGFLFYYASVKLSHAIGSYSFMRLASAKFYIFVLIVAAIASLFSFRFAFVSDVFSNIGSAVSQGLGAAEGLFMSWEDRAVINSGMVTNEELLTISTGSVVMQTGIVDTGAAEPIVIKTINFADALTHLVEVNNIPASSKKTVKFRYVSYTNALYPIFSAAYSKRLIGSSTNPVSLVRCDVYQVMKGILAGWKVSGKVSVLDQYWNYANANDLLNGCVAKGDTVMTNNL